MDQSRHLVLLEGSSRFLAPGRAAADHRLCLLGGDLPDYPENRADSLAGSAGSILGIAQLGGELRERREESSVL